MRVFAPGGLEPVSLPVLIHLLLWILLNSAYRLALDVPFYQNARRSPDLALG